MLQYLVPGIRKCNKHHTEHTTQQEDLGEKIETCLSLDSSPDAEHVKWLFVVSKYTVPFVDAIYLYYQYTILSPTKLGGIATNCLYE